MDLEVIKEIWEVIQDRKDNPKEGSYTNLLLENEDAILEKLNEELGEVEEAARENKLGPEKDSLEWESADLIYHLLVLLAAKGVKLEDVLAELRKRR